MVEMIKTVKTVKGSVRPRPNAENGYSSERELIKDNGKKYVKEQIYIKIVKKFLYNYNVKK